MPHPPHASRSSGLAVQTSIQAHAELLSRVELFAELDRVALAQLAAYLEPLSVGAETAVCRQGEVGDGLYIVARGSFAVYSVDQDGAEARTVRLGTLAPGDYFGEMAVISQEPRAATVRAETSGEVLRLEPSRFQDLIHRQPAIGLSIAVTLSRRVRALDRVVLEQTRAIGQVVEDALGRLPPERRRAVLQASLLAEPSARALRLLFGEEAEPIREALAGLGCAEGCAAGPVRRELFRRFQEAAGPGEAAAFAHEAARHLEAGGCWDDALGVLEPIGPRADFLVLLGRAVRAGPAGDACRERWLTDLSDDEATQDAEVALARAALFERRGEYDRAERTVQRSLGSQAARHGPEGIRRLVAELDRLAAAHEPAPDRAGAARPGWQRPGAGQVLAASLAIGLGAVAAFGGLGSQTAFVLLLVAASVLWISRLLPDYAVGLGLIASWVLLGMAAPAQAALGFASLDWLFVVAILGFAAAISRSGLLFRAGVFVIQHLPKGLVPQAGVLLLMGVVLGPILPSNNGRAALTAPLALAIAEASRLRDREPGAAVLGLAAWIGSSPLSFMFLNGASLCLIAWGLLPDASRARFDWIHWFVAAAPLGVFLGACSLVLLFLLLRPSRASAPDTGRLRLQLALLGPVSGRDRALIGVLALTACGWLFSATLHLDIRVVAILGLLATILTGNLGPRAFQALDWSSIFFYGVALSVARLGTGLGLEHSVENAIGGHLDPLRASPLLFVLAIATLHLLIRLVLPQEQAVLLLSLALIPIAPAIGVEPWVVIAVILATCVSWFFPAQTSSYLVACAASEGRLFSPSQARRMAFAYTALTIIGLAATVPYWRLLGLL